MAHSYDRAHAARIDSSLTERALRRESTRAGHVAAAPAALSWIVLLVFGVAFATMIVMLGTPRWLTALYGVMSVIAFFAYGFDKAAALRGGRRVSEQTLLTLGFAGGWPGALVAQQIFRHKTRKRSFRRRFWARVVVNVLLLGALVTVTPVGLGRSAGLGSDLLCSSLTEVFGSSPGSKLAYLCIAFVAIY